MHVTILDLNTPFVLSRGKSYTILRGARGRDFFTLKIIIHQKYTRKHYTNNLLGNHWGCIWITDPALLPSAVLYPRNAEQWVRTNIAQWCFWRFKNESKECVTRVRLIRCRIPIFHRILCSLCIYILFPFTFVIGVAAAFKSLGERW